MSRTKAAALEGIRVLDFSQMEQGPMASQMLGDMGAAVIKVEQPGVGDRVRFLGSRQRFYFHALNRNKKSITVNLKKREGKEIIYKLAQKCDVVLHNFRPGVMERLSLGYDKFVSINHGIVYCALSGYGQTGPYRRKPGQDLLSQAMSGIMKMTGEKSGPPIPLGTYVADAYTGIMAAFGIVVALFFRERTGEGQQVAMNLLNGMIHMQLQEATCYLNTHILPQRGTKGVAHAMSYPPYGVYETKDAYIAVVSRPWFKAYSVLGLDWVKTDSRFSSDEERAKNRDEAHDILQKALKQRTRAECLSLLEAEDIWCAPVYGYDEVFSDPQVQANKLVVSFFHPTIGEVKTIGNPLKMEKTPPQIKLPSPLLGQHTDQILSELGYTEQEIQQLKKEGTV